MEITPTYKAAEHENLRVSASNRGSADDKKRRNNRDRREPGRPTAHLAGYEDFTSDELTEDDDQDGVVSLLI